MCGIVGVVSNAKASQIVIEGLKRLEYRGYDSAGIAVLNNLGMVETHKAVGKLQALMDKLAAVPPSASSIAIGHTRWATHGVPSEINAHPHMGKFGPHALAVVHNGIIENYQELRAELTPQGVTFATQTDTETIPYAIASALEYGRGTFTQAVRAAAQKFRGSFAFVAMQQGNPNQLVGTRRGAPLCIGVGEGTHYFASDPSALAGLTNKFMFLEDGDVATITAAQAAITNAAGQPVTRAIKTIDLSDTLAGKQGYKHFMLKEIHEQPSVAARLIQTYTDAATLTPCLPLEGLNLAQISAINLIACGTAHYACLLAKYAIEKYAGIPVNVDVASEYRYRNPPFIPGGVFVAVSQSGETADTLAALELAKAAGQTIVVFTNVSTSSMARAADVVIDLMAGKEIAVASTKAFMAMSTTLSLFALQLGAARGMGAKEVSENIQALRTLPTHLTTLLAASTKPLEDLAERLTAARSILYLGRGLLTAIAYEGALKIKEVSYIHAEAYAAGEMKHGPIALVDKHLPVINLATGADGLFEKTLSNLHEVEARHGQIILFTDAEGAKQVDTATREKITLIPLLSVPAILTPMVFTVPLQLLAYHTATAKGTDVDQPRNLAKSVTVE